MSFQPFPIHTIAIKNDGRFTEPVSRWFRDLIAMLKPLDSGFSGTITTAKLTPGGTNGSMTFESGVLISETAAT